MNLKELHEKIKVCKKCGLWKTRTKAVPGEGPLDANIMFIGLAPGAKEDSTGRPFVGRSGKLLNKLLESINLERSKVFITSILKCRPPENRLPRADEIKSCKPYLIKQIEIVKPKIIVLLGNVALKTMLGKTGITKIHGEIFKCDKTTYFATFHPGAGIRSIKRKKLLYEDFKKLKELRNELM